MAETEPAIPVVYHTPVTALLGAVEAAADRLGDIGGHVRLHHVGAYAAHALTHGAEDGTPLSVAASAAPLFRPPPSGAGARGDFERQRRAAARDLRDWGAGDPVCDLIARWLATDSWPPLPVSIEAGQMCRHWVHNARDQRDSAEWAWTQMRDLVTAGDPVGIAEVADRLGVTRSAVRQWRERETGFPAQRWTVGGRPCWDWPEVQAWAILTGRDTHRP